MKPSLLALLMAFTTLVVGVVAAFVGRDTSAYCVGVLILAALSHKWQSEEGADS